MEVKRKACDEMEVKRKACDELRTSMVMNRRGAVVASPARSTRTNHREAGGSPTRSRV
jgi:hypothetical protein